MAETTTADILKETLSAPSRRRMSRFTRLGFLNHWLTAIEVRRRLRGRLSCPNWPTSRAEGCFQLKTPVSCRISQKKSQSNYGTNMSSDTSPRISCGTGIGVGSRLSLIRRAGFLLFRFMPGLVTMPQPNRRAPSLLPPSFRQVSLSILAALLFCASLTAQDPAAAPKSTAPESQKKNDQYKINVNVNLVVLHATVVDKQGRMVDDLGENDFRVLEDGVQQKLSVFSHADIPVTVGIDIDDSGSMREKRAAVNEAAVTFVKTSNPGDQVFVVNFYDEYYLDTPGNFASNMEELKGALAKIDSRGGTALYDAVSASIDHLKLGNRDKKAILVISDGEDNASRYSFPDLLRQAQQSNAVIYC